ncbi:MAG: energy transducer TonB, partial [Rhodospirillaceae bacterium]
MRGGLAGSVIFHVLVVAIAYFGLPVIAPPPIIDTAIIVDVVDVAEVSNPAPPPPKPEPPKEEKPKEAPPPPE